MTNVIIEHVALNPYVESVVNRMYAAGQSYTPAGAMQESAWASGTRPARHPKWRSALVEPHARAVDLMRVIDSSWYWRGAPAETGAWATVLSDGGRILWHDHRPSDYSWVWSVTDGGSLRFKDPEIEVPMKPGTFVFFSGHMQHMVPAYQGTANTPLRMSVACTINIRR